MIKYLRAKDGGISTQNGTTRAVRILEYYFDNRERSHDIFARVEIPKSGDAHPYLTALILSEISIDGNDGILRGTYNVQCIYTSSNLAGNLTAALTANTPPWQLPAFNVSTVNIDSVVPFTRGYNPKKDSLGAPSVEVVSSSGTPILAQTIRSDNGISFSYNVQTFNPSWVHAYSNTTNKNSISLLGYVYPAGTLTIKKLSYQPHATYDDSGNLKYNYNQVNAELEYNMNGTTQYFADRSLYCNKGRIYEVQITSGTKIIPVYGDYETLDKLLGKKGMPSPVSEPMNLDGKGNVVQPDDKGIFKTTYLGPFYEKFPLNWSVLGFPAKMEAQRHVTR